MTSIEERLQKKEILPFYETLNHNESVVSWIIRNSASNYLYFEDFLKFHGLFRGNHFDYDLEFTIADIQSIIRRSFSSQKVEYNPKEILKSSILENHISLIGTYRQSIKSPHSYCPNCLSSTRPYMNLKWRVIFLFGCSNCCCFLHRNCPYCNREIQVSKIAPLFPENIKNPFICCSCNGSLGDAPIIPLAKEELDDLIWLETLLFSDSGKSLQRRLIEVLLLFVSTHKLGILVRQHFKITEFQGGFNVISNQGKYIIVQASRYWLSNFHFVFNDLNKKYGLRMSVWKNHFTY